MDIQKLQQHNQLGDFNIRSFDSNKDYPILEGWFIKRGMPIYKSKNIPKVGFLCFYKEEPICAAFLRTCEGNVGIFDSLITNPESGLKIRRQCIHKIVDEILKYSISLGIYKIIAFSINKRIVEIAKSKGFSVLNHQVFSIDFTS